jgi:hypothetical protein
MPSLNSPMAENLDREIERITTLDLDDLRLRWRNEFGKRALTSLPKTLLVRMLIHRLQVDVFGELAPDVVRVLEGHAARGLTARQVGEREESGSKSPAVLNIKPGSVLSREWNGRVHRVMALETGFGWEGRVYRSLSGVARAITGTRWNGRRFFGVDRGRPRASAAPTKRGGFSVTLSDRAQTMSDSPDNCRSRSGADAIAPEVEPDFRSEEVGPISRAEIEQRDAITPNRPLQARAATKGAKHHDATSLPARSSSTGVGGIQRPYPATLRDLHTRLDRQRP